MDLLLLYEHYAHVMGLVFFQFVSSAKISESGLLFVFILIFIVHTLMGFDSFVGFILGPCLGSGNTSQFFPLYLIMIPASQIFLGIMFYCVPCLCVYRLSSGLFKV